MNVAFASGGHLDDLPTDAETTDLPVTDAPAQAAASSSDRDERGRFKKGNGGGPGNPYARHEEVNNIVHGVPAELLVPASRKLVPMLAGRKQRILSELVRETAEDIAALDGRPYDLEDDLAAAPPMQTAANGRARPNETRGTDLPGRLDGLARPSNIAERRMQTVRRDAPASR